MSADPPEQGVIIFSSWLELTGIIGQATITVERYCEAPGPI